MPFENYWENWKKVNENEVLPVKGWMFLGIWKNCQFFLIKRKKEVSNIFVVVVVVVVVVDVVVVVVDRGW